MDRTYDLEADGFQTVMAEIGIDQFVEMMKQDDDGNITHGLFRLVRGPEMIDGGLIISGKKFPKGGTTVWEMLEVAGEAPLSWPLTNSSAELAVLGWRLMQNTCTRGNWKFFAEPAADFSP